MAKVDKNLVEIYVPLVDDITEYNWKKPPMGMKKSEVKWYCYGRKTYPCRMTMGTPEQKKSIERLYGTAIKDRNREKRCLIPNGRGGYIRCPETNSCSNCGCWLYDSEAEKYVMCKPSEKCLGCTKRTEFCTNRPLSFEALTISESEDDKTIEIADSRNEEAEAVGLAVLEGLIDHLASFDEGYDDIFRLLYDNVKVADMAKQYGVAWSTMKDRVKKVRDIAKAYMGYEDK